MGTTLRPITRDVIAQVEFISGFPVEVTEDPDLPTFASVRMARGNLPAHIVTYKPAPDIAVDYLITYQCGFILRLFASPPDQRREIISTPIGREHVRQSVRAPDGPAEKLRLDTASAAQLQEQLLGGLIVHLRSIPIGLRVARWIRKTYPEFHSAQREAVLKELAQNREVLRGNMRQVMPRLILQPTYALNAAYALFWAQEYNEPDLTAGYQSGPNEREGSKLLNIWNSTPENPANDRSLVDAWASQLNLTGWYDWISYQPPG